MSKARKRTRPAVIRTASAPLGFLPSICGAAALAASIALGVPSRAADPAGVSILWTAPAGCPDVETVRARVVSLAGVGATLEAKAEVTREETDFRAVLEVRARGSVGERVLRGWTCKEVVESAAVVLALSATASFEPQPKRAPLSASAPGPPTGTPEGRKPKADPMAKRTPGIPGPSACHEPFGS